jgi:hypothetical protein
MRVKKRRLALGSLCAEPAMFLKSLKKQKASFFKALIKGAPLFVLCLVLFAACGKRPSDVDSPPGGRTVPRVYPSPATDPLP